MPGSVSILLGQVLQGSQPAFASLVKRFLRQFTKRADRQLGPLLRKAIDGEDVANSAFRSFWHHAANGKADPNRLSDRDDLLRLLAHITGQKVLRARRRYTQEKRSVARTVRDGDAPISSDAVSFSESFASREPTPEWIATFKDTMEHWLADLRPSRRQVVKLRLENWKNQEIAVKLGISLRAVERQLSEIRSIWQVRGNAPID
jgi:RNA polymerase sigma factor (sigma-70 family)